MRRSMCMLACVVLAGSPRLAASQTASTRADSVLVARVVTVLESASDLPERAISVRATNGVVTLAGSVVCAECGGSSTPNGSGTVQQSLGAVVRAVPGVQGVLFELVYRGP